MLDLLIFISFYNENFEYSSQFSYDLEIFPEQQNMYMFDK